MRLLLFLVNKKRVLLIVGAVFAVLIVGGAIGKATGSGSASDAAAPATTSEAAPAPTLASTPSDTPTPTVAPTPIVSTSPPATTAPATRCVDAGGVPAAIAPRLNSDLKLTGKAAAVKSSEFANAYMVAVEFTGPGVTEVGVWMTNKLDGTGLVYSVDGLAGEFSSWVKASTTDADANSTTDGVSEAKACVKS